MKKIIILMIIFNSTWLYAEDLSFKFAQIITRGSGCPRGSTDIIKTDDLKTVSILFSQMMAEVPQYDGDNENDEESEGHTSSGRMNEYVSRKVCNIVIKADLKDGEQIDWVQIDVDYRGATIMDKGTKSIFHSKLISFEGPRRQRTRIKNTIVKKYWRKNKNVDEDWFISGTKKVFLNSKCGSRNKRRTKLVLKNIVKARITPAYQNESVSAYIGLDSADINSKMKILVHTKKCAIAPRVRRKNKTKRTCRENMRWNHRKQKCVHKRRY